MPNAQSQSGQAYASATSSKSQDSLPDRPRAQHKINASRSVVVPTDTKSKLKMLSQRLDDPEIMKWSSTTLVNRTAFTRIDEFRSGVNYQELSTESKGFLQTIIDVNVHPADENYNTIQYVLSPLAKAIDFSNWAHTEHTIHPSHIDENIVEFYLMSFFEMSTANFDRVMPTRYTQMKPNRGSEYLVRKNIAVYMDLFTRKQIDPNRAINDVTMLHIQCAMAQKKIPNKEITQAITRHSTVQEAYDVASTHKLFQLVLNPDKKI